MEPMTRWLPLILFTGLAVCAAAQPKRPFSHKYHLTQVVGCEGCHKDAPDSTKAGDDLMPSNGACTNCHDEVHIPEARPSRVATFSHKQHLEQSKMKCLGCHAKAAEAETTTVRLLPEMKRCVVCHAHKTVNPPQSCRQCHAADMR